MPFIRCFYCFYDGSSIGLLITRNQVIYFYLQEIDAKEYTEKFTRTVEKLINKITVHDFDVLEMRKLVEFNLMGKVDFALFKKYFFSAFRIFAHVFADLLPAFLECF